MTGVLSQVMMEGVNDNDTNESRKMCDILPTCINPTMNQV